MQERATLDGLLVVDKPLGASSMDVVRRVRRAAGLGRRFKVGHAGTLDPLATGVVICCLGKATRQVERLMGLPKIYEATIDLTAFTTTDDREGERQEVSVAATPDEARLRAVLASLTGMIDQRPPVYSAIHVNGRRAYKLARQGEQVELPSRKVRIDAIELVHYAWPLARIIVYCGRGTYIRSLARDIGLKLGTGGHLAALRRTAVGPYTLVQAVDFDRLQHPLAQEDLCT